MCKHSTLLLRNDRLNFTMKTLKNRSPLDLSHHDDITYRKFIRIKYTHTQSIILFLHVHRCPTRLFTVENRATNSPVAFLFELPA